LPILVTDLDEGSYTKIEMTVARISGKIGSILANVQTSNNKLSMTKDFEIKNGETTSFVFDMIVTKLSNANAYKIEPNADASGTVGKEVAADNVRRV
ncbi:MAG: hypothetical protein ABIG30_03610, partial [Candidatus Aenigmatarchaeota archaeon]